MWDPQAETMPVAQRAELQGSRLAALAARLARDSPFYAARLAAAGVAAGDVRGIEDLPHLPFTEKQDLWDSYPLGMLAVPRRAVARVHSSPGTAGRPTLVASSRGDLELWAQLCARALGCAGASPGTVVLDAYADGLFSGGLGLQAGAEQSGCTVVAASSDQATHQVTLLRDLGAEILCCAPSYAARLGEALGRAGVAPDELALRAGVLGGEPWSEGMRRRIEGLLGIKALDSYGLAEVVGPGVACECLEAQDGLHVNEDHFLVEVVDPATGQVLGEGQQGELVLTTLTKEAMPVLRYRTGDIARLDRARCVCGRTLARMSKVLGRREDLLAVDGASVYPSQVEAVLMELPELAAEYRLVADRAQGVPRLEVVGELAAGWSLCAETEAADRDRVSQELAAALVERLGLRARVRVLGPGSLPRAATGGKATRVVTRGAAGDLLAGR